MGLKPLTVVIRRKKERRAEKVRSLLLLHLLQLVCSLTVYAETDVSASEQDFAKDRVVFAYSYLCGEVQRCWVQYKLG